MRPHHLNPNHLISIVFRMIESAWEKNKYLDTETYENKLSVGREIGCLLILRQIRPKELFNNQIKKVQSVFQIEITGGSISESSQL